jgi:pyruvate formate lyase activating enzyme
MGIVFDIRRGSIKDGPGLRTSVFLKGCPLRCVWCHNPESWDFKPQVSTDNVICGKEMSVQEVMAEVLRDKPFYALSGGGLTLTGGEPMAQAEFTTALAAAASSEGISVALDTCGEAPWEDYKRILPYVDIFLYDIKAADEQRHIKLTGVSNKRIIENLRRLGEAGAQIRFRCPIVPGVNDTLEYLEFIDRLHLEFKGCVGVDKLAYHPLGESKYAKFGIKPRAVL